MVPLATLWLPILLASVLVFVVSAIIWTALPIHKNDWDPLPDEDAVMAELRKQGVGPGMYNLPFAATSQDAASPEYKAKLEQGPVGMLHVQHPSTRTSMSKSLTQVFIFYLVLNFFVAYLASATLPAGVDYLKVFQVVGTSAFMAHGFAHVVWAIFFGATWSTTWKHLGDALIYGLLTAGVFGWLWPVAG